MVKIECKTCTKEIILTGISGYCSYCYGREYRKKNRAVMNETNRKWMGKDRAEKTGKPYLWENDPRYTLNEYKQRPKQKQNIFAPYQCIDCNKKFKTNMKWLDLFCPYCNDVHLKKLEY